MSDDRGLGPALWTARAALQAVRQRRFPYASAEGVRRAQARRVRATVAYANHHVPYYRETMRRAGLGVQDFSSARDLERLPLLERDLLQRDPEYFVSDQWPAKHCIALHSGGTTGAPVTIFRDPPSLFQQAAHFERLRFVIGELAGRRGRYREAAIIPPVSSTATAVTAFRARNRLPKDLRVARRTFSMLRAPSELVPVLQEWRPHVISSYGSYLDELFTYIRDEQPDFAAPRVAVYGADSISPSVRQWAADALGIEVLSTWGAIEAPHIGFECELHAGHHLNIDLYPVRLLDSGGDEAAAAAEGEVVVSNLVGRGTVLLNYRLGDLVRMAPAPCQCGRSLPLCSYLGREETQWLALGHGRRIHSQALKLVLRTEGTIWRYQIAQVTERELEIALVPSPGCEREPTAARIRNRMRQQLPEDVVLRVEFVSALAPDSSGKLQPVVSRLPAPD